MLTMTMKLANSNTSIPFTIEGMRLRATLTHPTQLLLVGSWSLARL